MTELTDHSVLWCSETYNHCVKLSFNIKQTLFSGTSPYQQIAVFDSAAHGRILMIDDKIMLTEKDEFIYHEMITHVPLFVHPKPENVLVIGGGDGGTVREILQHKTVQRIVLVEIDEMVIHVCKTFFPSLSCSLSDKRLELRIEDGIQYVTAATARFDVIIVDSTDPVGPAKVLFDRDFYKAAAGILKPNGIFIAQAESPFYDQHIQRCMLENQRPFFKRLHLYLFTNLSYPGGLWSFTYASNNICPAAGLDPFRITDDFSLNYYNADVHYASFMLPNFIKNYAAPLIDPVPYQG